MTELRERVDGGLHLMRQLNTAVNDLTRWQKEARKMEAEQYRRMQIRIQALTLVVATAGVIVPLALTILHMS